MEKIVRNPLPFLYLIKPSPAGYRYTVLFQNAIPTREIFSRISAQRVLARSRPAERILLHTHPNEVIALSLIYSQPDQLMGFITEKINYQKLHLIITVIEYLPNGSKEPARKTARAFKNHSLVIWQHPSVIAASKTIYSALKLIKNLNDIVKND